MPTIQQHAKKNYLMTPHTLTMQHEKNQIDILNLHL